MSTHKRVITSPEVWAVIKARHGKELKVFETFSDPDYARRPIRPAAAR